MPLFWRATWIIIWLSRKDQIFPHIVRISFSFGELEMFRSLDNPYCGGNDTLDLRKSPYSDML